MLVSILDRLAMIETGVYSLRKGEMKQPIVIYHADCWDGFCAAWLFHQAFPDAEFHAAAYGTDPPDVAGREVFIVDFSYKLGPLLQILRDSGKVTVLDHHKTAEEDLATFRWNTVGSTEARISGLTVVFDKEKSGGRLAWEYLKQSFFGVMNPFNEFVNVSGLSPWLVNYTEDRDLWRWELLYSKEINAYIRSWPLDFETWDNWGKVNPGCDGWDDLITGGDSILRRERQIIDDHVKHAHELEMNGYKVLCVNATVLFSEIAGELAKGRSFGVCYFDLPNGKRQYSLRSDPDGVDVSEIAKLYGGGGHKHAAGFESPDVCSLLMVDEGQLASVVEHYEGSTRHEALKTSTQVDSKS